MNTTALMPPQSRKVSAGRAIDWWKDAWALFVKAPVFWIVLAVVMIVSWLVLQVVPVLGQLIAALSLPIFVAGFQWAARQMQAGNQPDAAALIAAVQVKLVPLAILGGFILAATLAVTLVGGLLGAGALLGTAASGAADSSTGIIASLGIGFVGITIALVASALIGMAVWFAPALVMFADASPVAALQASFAANLKNVPAFLLFGLLYLLAAILASIPFGLGWIVLVPVVMLASWTSYLDVFSTSTGAAATA